MNRPAISIVVPAFNEAENLTPLIERVHQTCTYHDLTYELIIIDDRSTDHTLTLVQSLSRRYPLKSYSKQGPPGKATSLLEGFAKAKFALIAMIDADLQYPPENIPHMVSQLLLQKADIIVANRNERDESGFRTFVSQSFQAIFAKWLHQIEVDSQSGLKVFKKTVLKDLALSPKPWSFDLEFLIKARDAGHAISGHDIAFKERINGTSKVSVVQTSLEIGWEALKLKFRPSVVYRKKAGFAYRGQNYIHYNRLPLNETALMTVTPYQKQLLLLAASALAVLFLFNWQLTLILALGFMSYFYFADVVFNFFLVTRSIVNNQDYAAHPKEVASLSDEALPTYTIFCPLYKEAHVLPQFVEAMKQLDYPAEKIQILLLLETDDKKTINRAKNMILPNNMQIVIVPHTLPKTKPKACNYGLQIATGDIAVIYDAEDMPDPLQLKKTALAFRNNPDDVICVQAKLNFYNPGQNLLTRLFATEYSLWFDLILPGLQSLNAPLPLGGTSNHFKTAALKQLGGWDAFNVTEDCDLGIRLAANGYRTIMIDSVTLEEANSDTQNWLNQRSRWLKGYMQTYLVHMRQAGRMIKQGQNRLFAGINMIVGGKLLALLINPLLWTLFILYFGLRPLVGPTIEALFPAAIFYIAVAAFVAGNFLYLYYFMVAVAKTGRYHLARYALFMPGYWLLISISAWKALVQLIFKPHYWFKTKHGLHLKAQSQKTDLARAIN
jgi:glycosyltransferase XagB